MDEPVEDKSFRSFMAKVLADEEDITVCFPMVVPTRTFLEKIFLLLIVVQCLGLVYNIAGIVCASRCKRKERGFGYGKGKNYQGYQD